MNVGRFYFLKEEYFSDFPDRNVMRNKELGEDGTPHNRPCFYAVEGEHGIFWLVPISSIIEKYQGIYNKKMLRNGRCDTLAFGTVLGKETVFLIQNIIPVTGKYIENEYCLKNNTPVEIDIALQDEVLSKTRRVLKLVRKGGKKITLTHIVEMEKQLLGIDR
jgi:hypothetical protein